MCVQTFDQFCTLNPYDITVRCCSLGLLLNSKTGDIMVKWCDTSDVIQDDFTSYDLSSKSAQDIHSSKWLQKINITCFISCCTKFSLAKDIYRKTHSLNIEAMFCCSCLRRIYKCISKTPMRQGHLSYDHIIFSTYMYKYFDLHCPLYLSHYIWKFTSNLKCLFNYVCRCMFHTCFFIA